MGVLIGADIVPTKSNYELFSNGDARELVGQELLNILAQADLRILNLEVPLTDVEAPIQKCGPNLIAPRSTVAGYRALGANLLTLANNHIMDQGVQGLESTRSALEEADIACLGAGRTPEEAAKPYIADIRGNKIGVYACAEHEFSIVSDTCPGANPYDPLESFDHVARLKEECSFVIVLYHGGKEQYRYPSPGLQRVCRKFIEKGADLVVCQHSHCIGCEEKYDGGVIVYGQGNFLFDHSNSVFWQTGLLIGLDEDWSVSYIPVVKKDNVVRLAEGEREEILTQFRDRSEQLREPGFIEAQYARFAAESRSVYLTAMSGYRSSYLFRVCRKLFGERFVRRLFRWRYSKKDLLAIQNYVECEAHRELMLNAIKVDGIN